jgi:tetratricopeptide (TPR) repeat protein
MLSYLLNEPRGRGRNNFVLVSHGISLLRCSELTFFVEHNITPRTLVLLALILLRCKEVPRHFLGIDILFFASAIGEPTATIYLVDNGLKKKYLDSSRYIAPLTHLRALAAPPHSNIEAMVLLGKVYESQKEDDKALQMYRQAASTSPSNQAKVDTQLPLPGEGVASALVRQGLILGCQGNSSDASAAFGQAALEHDDPAGYYHLGRLQTPFSAAQEMYFLKAASSGIAAASTSLGQLHLAKAMLVPAENKDQKVKQEKLAKEWLFLAATAGEGQSMLRLADIFIEENKMESARKWLQMAEKSTDPEVAERAKHLIEQIESNPFKLEG